MQKTEKSNSTLLKFTPIIGIAVMVTSKYMDALNIEGILSIVLIVSSISAILATLENYKESDNTSLIFEFTLMQLVWFAAYPIHFLQKEEKEKKGQYALVAAFFAFVLIVGAGEMYRFGFLKNSDEYRSNIFNMILGIISLISITGAPIIISNALNSIKKSYAIIFTLLSFAILVAIKFFDVKNGLDAVGYFTSFVLYIFALRMSFHKNQ